ncbi:GIY-YIG nuclease family protein [Sorangium sp. So ce1024]|uniref:GIY-YIG nuclease family protein n=1 Tax=Sorangium sp. So ce1024 TaxID=3133327 RepID=UPI003F051651
MGDDKAERAYGPIGWYPSHLELLEQEMDRRIAAGRAEEEAKAKRRKENKERGKAQVLELVDGVSPFRAAKIWGRAADDIGHVVYSSPTHVRLLAEQMRNGMFDASRSFVYFIGTKAAADPVKIGTAMVPAQRLKDLQGANPVELHVLASFPGNVNVERAMHGIFARDRIRGEWFRRSPVIIDFIEHLNRGLRPEAKRPVRRR